MIFRRLFRAVLGLPETALFHGVEIMPEIKIGDRLTLKAQPKLDNGQPAVVESMTWETSDDSVVELTSVNPDGTALFTGVSPGDAELMVEADADLGAGVVSIRSGMKITVKQDMATGIAISVVSVAPPEVAPEIKKRPGDGSK